MTLRSGLGLALVLVLAAGCATTPTAVGSAALREGRPEEAVAQFEKALAEEPGRVDALIGLGIARYRLGAYDDAIVALSDAVTRAPDQAIVLLGATPVSDAGRTYLIASLDYAAEWSREVAEARLALRQAQLAWDPFWIRPTYVIRCRHC